MPLVKCRKANRGSCIESVSEDDDDHRSLGDAFIYNTDVYDSDGN